MVAAVPLHRAVQVQPMRAAAAAGVAAAAVPVCAVVTVCVVVVVLLRPAGVRVWVSGAGDAGGGPQSGLR